MNLQMMTEFFMWSTVINGGLLVFWTFFILLIPDVVYRLQSKLITVSRETFDIVIYGFLGVFKIFFIVFNVTPYIALIIIG